METLIKILSFILIISSSSETYEDWMMDKAWSSMTEQERYESPVEYKARAVGLTVEEFDLMSRVVEAESDRSGSIDGRILIALTLYNRVESESFPNDLLDVIYDPGQFEVVENGAIWSVGRTNLSDWAIIEAHRWIAEGDAPYVLYFNNSNYAYGAAYGYVDGNYFTVGG